MFSFFVSVFSRAPVSWSHSAEALILTLHFPCRGPGGRGLSPKGAGWGLRALGRACGHWGQRAVRGLQCPALGTALGLEDLKPRALTRRVLEDGLGARYAGSVWSPEEAHSGWTGLWGTVGRSGQGHAGCEGLRRPRAGLWGAVRRPGQGHAGCEGLCRPRAGLWVCRQCCPGRLRASGGCAWGGEGPASHSLEQAPPGSRE